MKAEEKLIILFVVILAIPILFEVLVRVKNIFIFILQMHSFYRMNEDE